MIASFRSEGTEDVYHGRDTAPARAECAAGVLERARRRLDLLAAASRLADLAVPPGTRLHPLAGPRSGQHAVRIDPAHALCFVWKEEGARNVEIADLRRPPSGPMAERPGGAASSPEERAPTHPGEMLREELLGPLKLTQSDLAALAGFPAEHAALLLNRHLDLTPELASSLERFFGASAEMWLGLQAAWDAYQRRRISWAPAAASRGRRVTGGRKPAAVVELASRARPAPAARPGPKRATRPTARGTTSTPAEERPLPSGPKRGKPDRTSQRGRRGPPARPRR